MLPPQGFLKDTLDKSFPDSLCAKLKGDEGVGVEAEGSVKTKMQEARSKNAETLHKTGG